MLKEIGIEFRPIVFLALAREGITRGFVLVVGVVLREDTHPEFVEWGLLEGFEGLLFEFLPLMNPGVTGGADRKVRGAIGILKAILVNHFHGAAIPLGGGNALEGSGLAIQFLRVGCGFVFPGPLGVGHETDSIGPLAIVKALRFEGPVPLSELGG